MSAWGVRGPLLVLLLASGSGGLACAQRPSHFDQALLRARTLERQDRFDAAAAAYAAAEASAADDDERAEAIYRLAQSQKRAHAYPHALATLNDLVERYPHSSRAPRALLDQGRLWEDLEQPGRAAERYLLLLRTYPESSGAIAAVTAYARLQPGPRSRIYRRLLTHRPSGDLEEELQLRLGIALEEEGDLRKALETLEGLAQNHPLPRSTRADDALLRAAGIRRKLGDFEGSLIVLGVLLDQETGSDIVGSYVRSTYPQGAWLRAEILRDDLRRDAKAQAAFEELAERYPSSLLTDDALLQAAFLARFRGESQQACQLATRLQGLVPRSRYVDCVDQVCPQREPPARAECDHLLEVIPARIRDTNHSSENLPGRAATSPE